MSINDFWRDFWWKWGTGQWEPETKAQLQRFLKPDSIFVDIGAWIGPVTLWALELGARVIAVEPDPVALVEFKRQLQPKTENGALVELWEGACAPFNGELSLSPYELGDSMTQVTPGVGRGTPCWTLEHILNGRVPALVKMDVEGYETELLPRVGPFLAAMKVPLLVSMHSIMPPRPEWFAGYANVAGVARVTSWGELIAT
jgi:FkbM family methyltransferase